MNRRKLAVAMVCFGALAATGGAQTAKAPAPADQTTTFKSGGEEVVLDVVVRDKKGHAVKDLKAADFQVLDNGESRSVKTFRLVEGTETVSSTGARTQLDPLRQIRLVTLIFHGLDQNGRLLSRDAAMSLIKSELGQNVYMSVMSIDHSLQAIQQFTNDRELLKRAIERGTGGSHDFSVDSAHIVQQLQQTSGPVQGGTGDLASQVGAMTDGATGTSGPGSAPNGSSAANAAMAQMMLQMLTASQQDASADTGQNAVYALLDAVKAQYRLPGRKTVLFFSSGFSVPQSAETPFRNVISIANRSNVSFYAIDARGLTVKSMNLDAVNNAHRAAAADRDNATPGKVVSMDMAKQQDRALDSGKANTQETLARLAHETGGELIANSNDFKGPLRKLEEDIETYYEISYEPHIEKYDGSFHNVAVKTTEPAFRVQSRSGYFALPPSMTVNGQVIAPYEVPLLQALEQKPLPRQFSFQSTGMHYRADSGSPTCDIVLDVPIANLTLEENKAAGQYEGKLAYVVIVKDMQGEILKKFHNEIALKITPDKLEAFKAGHFVYAEPFELKAGRYTLEAAVFDGQGSKISARKTSFMVPVQNSNLSISSIAVVRNMKPADANAKPNDPLTMEHKSITPFVNPTVKKSDSEGLPFYVVIYADKTKSDKPGLQMEFSRDGQVLGSVMAPIGEPDALGRIQYVATAPLGKFEPGSYQVRFIAKQGSEAAVESATFTLEP